MLYSLYINDIIDSINSLDIEFYKIPTYLTNNDVKSNVFLFADDIAILSKNNQDLLKVSKCIENHSVKNNYKFNTKLINIFLYNKNYNSFYKSFF